ncbi:hypothetical protein [Helcococcus sueciensis]|uniref:hypothetical protein n=1 Tax=Helcococcus sueciensis TaxID=241555 RepID=UPI00042A16CD|nr:hypothetical protein [Helcococcus sueciensis]
MTSEKFWEMSLDEIDLYFEQIKINRKKELNDIQTLATLITNGVAICLNGSDKVEKISVYDMYEDIFEEDLMKAKEKQKQIDLEVHKAKMNAFMARFNARRKEV